MITLPKKLLIGAIFSSMVLYLLVIIHPHQATAASCHSVHIFSARGYEEPYDATMNRLDFFVVPAVCKGRSSCGYEDVIYPALFPDSEDEYCRTSEMEGVINAEAQIKDYAYRCPRSKIVLVGYNQGAQIMGDVLSGGGGLSCNASNVPLDPATVPGNMSKYFLTSLNVEWLLTCLVKSPPLLYLAILDIPPTSHITLAVQVLKRQV